MKVKLYKELLINLSGTPKVLATPLQVHMYYIFDLYIMSFTVEYTYVQMSYIYCSLFYRQWMWLDKLENPKQ